MVMITGHTTYVHRQAGTQNKLTRHTLSLWASSRITVCTSFYYTSTRQLAL